MIILDNFKRLLFFNTVGVRRLLYSLRSRVRSEFSGSGTSMERLKYSFNITSEISLRSGYRAPDSFFFAKPRIRNPAAISVWRGREDGSSFFLSFYLDPAVAFTISSATTHLVVFYSEYYVLN